MMPTRRHHEHRTKCMRNRFFMYEVVYETKKLIPLKCLIRMPLMSSRQVKANLKKINNIFFSMRNEKGDQTYYQQWVTLYF
jgi:hypothetical protein